MSQEGNEHWAGTWELSTFMYICDMETVVLVVVRHVTDVLISLKSIFFKWRLGFPDTGIKPVGDTEAETL